MGALVYYWISGRHAGLFCAMALAVKGFREPGTFELRDLGSRPDEEAAKRDVGLGV